MPSDAVAARHPPHDLKPHGVGDPVAGDADECQRETASGVSVVESSLPSNINRHAVMTKNAIVICQTRNRHGIGVQCGPI